MTDTIRGLRARLRDLIASASNLDGILSEADPDSLQPLDVVTASVDIAQLEQELDRIGDRLANAALPARSDA